MVDLNPFILGFIAGATVIIGALPVVRAKLSKEKIAYLSLLASGILAYIALDTGASAGEAIEEMLIKKDWIDFLISALTTSIAIIGTWYILSTIDGNRKPSETVQNTPLTLATALGVHNIGEGFAIASALLAGAISSALTFTIAFGVHNMTEGFAIVSPGKLTHSKWLSIRNILLLSLIAGLPVSLGASIYYLGIQNEILFANLNSIATAALIYPMIRINIVGASLLGGFNRKFWTWYFLGIAFAYSLESIMTAALL